MTQGETYETQRQIHSVCTYGVDFINGMCIDIRIRSKEKLFE
jgi:hypothetical protein